MPIRRARARIGAIITGSLFAAIPSALAEGSNQIQMAIGDISRRTRQIMIPKVELKDATLNQAVDFLSTQSAKQSPDGDAIRFSINLDAAPLIMPSNIDGEIRERIQNLYQRVPRCDPQTNRTVTVSLRNVPLLDAVRYLSSLFLLKTHLRPDGVEVGCPRIEAKVYEVRPELFDRTTNGKATKYLSETGKFIYPSEILTNRMLLIQLGDEDELDEIKDDSPISKYLKSEIR